MTRIVLVIAIWFLPTLGWAEPEWRPNPSEYVRMMTEHNLGVEVTMHYLVQHSSARDIPEIAFLINHPDFLNQIAGQHDWGKINQRPDFLARFKLPKSPTMAEKLVKFYGINFRWHEGDPVDQPQLELIKEGRATIAELNRVETALFEQTLHNYVQANGLSAKVEEALRRGAKRLEKMADLLNRKMHEKILMARHRGFSEDPATFTFEFGYEFSLYSNDNRAWDGHSEDRFIAQAEMDSLDLWRLFRSALQKSTVNEKIEFFRGPMNQVQGCEAIVVTTR